MECIGKDTGAITSISIESLTELCLNGRVLDRVEIEPIYNNSLPKARFIFKDKNSKDLQYYDASGFSIGYGGEGPHGLHRAIRLWYPDDLDRDFWKTPISQMRSSCKWTWSPKDGFILTNEVIL